MEDIKTFKMKKEEKIINGILCWRFSDEVEWHTYTQKDLTKKILEYRKNETIIEFNTDSIKFEPKKPL